MTAPRLLMLPALSRSDRCDRCPAAAQLRAVLPPGELLFCAHHARKHRTRLIAAGALLSPDLAGDLLSATYN